MSVSGSNWDIKSTSSSEVVVIWNMVRPKASRSACDFASTFAFAVTAVSSDSEDLVARCGSFSIFALLSRVAPKVSWSAAWFLETPSNDGFFSGMSFRKGPTTDKGRNHEGGDE